jgi:hypothetical protein
MYLKIVPEWTRYWWTFTNNLHRQNKCFCCDRKVEKDELVLQLTTPQQRLNGIRASTIFYCSICAFESYKSIRKELLPLEDEVREKAKLLGHDLNQFRPGYLCHSDYAILVADCKGCGTTVCYSVIDSIHDPRRIKDKITILEEPFGFPVKHVCPGHPQILPSGNKT